MHSQTKAVVIVVRLVLAVSVAVVQVLAHRVQPTVKVVVKAVDVLSTVKVAVVHVVKRALPPLHVVVMHNDLTS